MESLVHVATGSAAKGLPVLQVALNQIALYQFSRGYFPHASRLDHRVDLAQFDALTSHDTRRGQRTLSRIEHEAWLLTGLVLVVLDLKVLNVDLNRRNLSLCWYLKVVRIVVVPVVILTCEEVLVLLVCVGRLFRVVFLVHLSLLLLALELGERLLIEGLLELVLLVGVDLNL